MLPALRAEPAQFLHDFLVAPLVVISDFVRAVTIFTEPGTILTFSLRHKADLCLKQKNFNGIRPKVKQNVDEEAG